MIFTWCLQHLKNLIVGHLNTYNGHFLSFCRTLGKLIVANLLKLVAGGENFKET